MPLPSTERLSEIIGSIYDCVLMLEKWPATLRSISDEIGCSSAALTVHDSRTSDCKRHVAVGMDDEWVAQAERYSVPMLEIWGGPARIAEFAQEEPVVLSDATPRSTWLANAWYRDLGLPRQQHDCIAMTLAQDSRTFSAIAFGVHQNLGDVQDGTLTALRFLAPHLRRAVVISRVLEDETSAATALAETMDGVAAGILLVDDGAEIVHANTSAQSMLSTGDTIKEHRGRLSTTSALTTTVLDEAIAQSAASEAGLDRRSIDIPARRSDGMPTAIQVLPLQRRAQPNGLKQRAAAAVFVTDAADPPRLPADALSLLYKLTPAEAKVFELIVAGQTPAEIAHLLALKLVTVRAHLSRVFEKTGCGRQADLVALASSLTMPV